MPTKLNVPKALETKMRAKTPLYQFASLSLAVAQEQKSDFAFQFVEQQLSRVSPPKAAFNSATTHFERIISSDDAVGYMNWAREWLLDIGIDETNPAVLGMFTYGWVQHHLLAIETLNGVALRATS